MLLYRQGNLLSSEDRLLAHGVNAQGVMGSGVALAIRNKYPEVYQQYRQIYEKSGLAIGSVILSYCNDGKIIANCVTQNNYGRDGRKYVDYDAIDSSMKELNRICLELSIQQISMPMIGSGLGGGNWEIIEKIIDKNLNSIEVTIWGL